MTRLDRGSFKGHIAAKIFVGGGASKFLYSKGMAKRIASSTDAKGDAAPRSSLTPNAHGQFAASGQPSELSEELRASFLSSWGIGRHLLGAAGSSNMRSHVNKSKARRRSVKDNQKTNLENTDPTYSLKFYSTSSNRKLPVEC